MKNFVRSQAILTGIVLFILFAGLSILFGTMYMNIQTQTKQNLSLYSEIIESEIALFFSDFETELHDTARHILLSSTDDEHLFDYLKTLADYRPSLYSIYYLKEDHTFINSGGFVPPADVDLKMRPWYQMAESENKVIYTPGYLNASEDLVIVTMAMAIRDETGLLGVIGADIIISNIREYVSSLHIGKTGIAIVLDQNGNMLADAYKGSDDAELRHISTYINDSINLNERDFYQDIYVNGVRGVLKRIQSRDGAYNIIVFLSHNEYREKMNFLSSLFVVLVLIFIMMEVGLIVINNRMIIHPLIKLENDILSLDMNKNITYRLPKEEANGFVEVRPAVNEVLDKIEATMEIKKRYYHELTLENQRFLMIVESTADIIFEVDLERKFSSVYGKGLHKIKKTAEDFVGKSIIDVFGDIGKERHEFYLRALQGKKTVYDWDTMVDGETFYFESSIAPILNENGDIVGAVGVSRDITEAKKRQDEIEYMSVHDFLTGLYNRRYFSDIAEKMDQEDFYPLGIVMVDLNGLKIINDAFGHSYGDEALIVVSNILKSTFKQNHIICRIGGDEFSVIVPHASPAELEAYKNEIKKELANIRIQNLDISIAYGYEIKYNRKISLEEVNKLAENDMYRRKLLERTSVRNQAIQAILKTLNDKYQGERIHSEKVSALCKSIGIKLGIKDEDLKELELAGLYHDIGKITIPDAILDKPGKFTAEEFEIMKTHTESGYQILKAADQYSNLADYALYHHERWDGNGYPRKLKGDNIPLYARIITIADSFEAMITDRVYQKKKTRIEAVQEIIKHSGTQFDKTIAKVFVEQVLGEKWGESVRS